MLVESTKLNKSPINGIGLFATNVIKQNTVVARVHPKFDRIFSEKEVEEMDDLQKEFIKIYAVKQRNWYIVSLDNERFMNHSENNNISSINGKLIANRDIFPEEEIICNYNEICEIGIDFEINKE